MRQELGQMAAPLDSAHGVVQRFAKTVQDAGADELGIGTFDAVAGSHVGHRVGAHTDVADAVVGPERDARPHVVHGITGSAHAGKQSVVVILDVGEMAFEIEKAILAPEAFVGHAPRVQAGPGRGWLREGHGVLSCGRLSCGVPALRSS